MIALLNLISVQIELLYTVVVDIHPVQRGKINHQRITGSPFVDDSYKQPQCKREIVQPQRT